MANDATGSSPMFPPVPGFDFLQGLVKKNAGVGLPGFGQWVAPTLNPEEVEKRIDELKAVQFWLEQNARMLGATIQALEVQRMTLSTLKTMNVRMTDLRDALTMRPPDGADAAAKPSPAPAPAAAEPAKSNPWYPMASMFPAPAPARENAARAAEVTAPAPAPAAAVPAGGAGPVGGPEPSGTIDAMQWWTALTQQFSDLATAAMRDTATAAQQLAGGMLPVAGAQNGTAAQGAAAAAPADTAPKAPGQGGGRR
jgi:hypothetical protein